MAMISGIKVAVRLSQDVETARRAGVKLALALGFDEESRRDVEACVEELASNIVERRTEGGMISLIPIATGGKFGLEIESRDEGPGIVSQSLALGEDVAESLLPHRGLPAIKNILENFEMESEAEGGTTIRGRIWSKRKRPDEVREKVPPTSRLDISVRSRARRGERVNGDGSFVKWFDENVLLAAIDGYGYGEPALEATEVVLRYLEGNHRKTLDVILKECHRALSRTKGAALSIFRIDFLRRRLHYAGVGTIIARICNTPEPIRLVRANGILGRNVTPLRASEHPYFPGSVLVMFTDGISSSFDLAPFRDLGRLSAREIAEVAMRKFLREDDDATIIVAK
ncbi:MAG: ATP-binding protein [bacterium]